MAKTIRGRNEGSVFRLSSGKWRAQISVEGSRLSASFSSKADALKWIRDQKTKLDRGFDFLGSKVALKDYLVQWLENNKAALRTKTIYQYTLVINKHIIPQIGGIELRD